MRAVSNNAFGLRLAILLLLVLHTACTDDAPTAPPDPPDPGDDTFPPTQVVDLALSYTQASDDAVLTWTAPRDNDRVAGYDIRYSYSFPLNWELAHRVASPPAPSAPGIADSATIVDPTRGRDLYAAIRSVDASGNVSRISSIAHTRILGHTLVATCVVAITDAPIAGLEATVTARHVHSHVSNAEGRFTQGDLTAGAVNVAVRPGTSGVPYHYVNHTFELDDDVSLDYKLIPYEPTLLGRYESLFQMFKVAAGLGPLRPVFKKWRSIPVPVYMPDFVNVNGIDYGEIGRQAVARWEERTGIDLFELVASPPDTGVVVAFKTRAEMRPHIGVTRRSNDPEGFPLLDEIDVVDDFNGVIPYLTTMLHELGHTIRLEHLEPGYLMYAGQPLPADVTDDEARVVQLYTALPNNFNFEIYDESTPQEAKGPE